MIDVYNPFQYCKISLLMAKMDYNWKRYWCLREGSFNIDANGFLLRGEYLNKDTVEFESIAEIPCLILLGEPGIGKSRALRDAVEFVSKSFPNDRCFLLDLRSFSTRTEIYDALFKSKEIEEWLNGTHRLHIFLDSFDECLQRVDTIAPLLIDQFRDKNYPVNRLLLKLASRTADFPKFLEENLPAIWKPRKRELPLLKSASCPREPAVRVYELCPLQASDVLEAARLNGLNADEFFKEIMRTRSGVWAARPYTLLGIINVYRKNNCLPEKLTDLHEQNARILCDEQNTGRRLSPMLKGNYSADQKLNVAARIAAVTVICNKIAIWKEAETGENDSSDILLRELTGYSEESGNIAFQVTEEALRETLFQTGLFTARDANRLGWAHQMFAEFLASWYIARHNLDGAQISSLIINPADPEQQVTPQLQETVAWLANLRPDVTNELLKTDPIVLLRSDVATFSADLKAKLVDELLKIFGGEKASDWGLHSNYQRLKHPGLAAQLLPVIKDKTANYLTRRFVIDVAEACDLRELQNDLADVILDVTEPDYVRANAGYALWHVGDAETRKRIKHYAINGSPNDKDERVRGVALLCNWDENLSAKEVFSSFVHSPHLLDSYGLFLSSHFLPKLKIEDLPIALRWVKENASRFGGDFSIERVIDKIMLFGWQNLDAPGILQNFAQAALVRLRLFNHHIIKLSNIREDVEISESLTEGDKRRKVLKAITPLLDDEKHDYFRVSQSPLLKPRKEDLFWLFDQLSLAKTEDEQRIWLSLLGNFYFPWAIDPEIFSILSEAYQTNEAVKKHYSWVFTPTDFRSPEAQAQKESYERLISPRKEMESELQQNALVPTPKERVLECLDKFEKGDIDFWWDLNLQLTLMPYAKVYGDELQFDLRKLPGWQEADAEAQLRIIEAAKKYVIEGEPQNDKWVGTNTIFRPAFAGYRALYLLLAESPEFVKQLSGEVWLKWAVTIVSYPLNSHGDEKEMLPHQFLVARAYEHAPDKVIRAVLKQIDWENEKGDLILFPQRLDVCWDDKFKNALREKLNDAALKINSWGRIVEELIEHGDAPTQEIAQKVLTAFIADEAEKERALLAAASLMRQGKGADWWSFVWEAIKRDAEFGRSLVEAVCFRTRPSNKLNESETADFYLWLVENFPPSEDPELPTGFAYAVSTRMEITTFRDSLISDLKQLGTPESLAALERIAATSPELEKRLHWTLIEARENVRRHSWQPPTPAELLDFLKRKTPDAASPVSTKVMKALLSDEEISKLYWNGETVAEVPALFDFLRIYRDRPNDVVFFTGAGLSRPLFPGWESALQELVTRVSRRLGYSDREVDLRKMLSEGKFPDVADACARDVGENIYRAFIEENFDKEFTIGEVPKAYADLLNLRPQTVMTTNYDRIPEVGGQGRYRIFTKLNIGEADSAIQNNKPIVFKLHGSVTQQNSIVFTRTEYQNTYHDYSFKGFLEAVFRHKPLVFIGFGLTDPYFNFVLENIYAVNQRILTGKFALLEGLNPTEIQSKERSYGLHVIPYDKSGDTHPEVLDFVHLLATVRGL